MSQEIFKKFVDFSKQTFSKKTSKVSNKELSGANVGKTTQKLLDKTKKITKKQEIVNKEQNHLTSQYKHILKNFRVSTNKNLILEKNLKLQKKMNYCHINIK